MPEQTIEDLLISNQLQSIADVSLGASDIREMIALRAYQLYKQRGTEFGDELSDWLSAEAEVVTMLLSESPDAAETRARNAQPQGATRNGRSLLKAGNGTKPRVHRLPKRKNRLKSNPA